MSLIKKKRKFLFIALWWPVHELQFKSVLKVSVRPDIYCLHMQNSKNKQEKKTDLSMKPTVLRLLFPVELFFVPNCCLVTSKWPVSLICISLPLFFGLRST